MSLRIFLTAILAAFFVSAPAHSEPVADRLIGRVTIRNPAKLDGQAKKEIAASAAKIKKILPAGTIKLMGDVPSAESQDEYLSRSVFIARNVETYLKTLVSGRYQIFIMASKYSAEKRAAADSVEIHLYPHELKVEGAGFISSQVTSDAVPIEPQSVQEPVQEPVALPSSDSAPLAQTPTYNGLLTPPPSDEEYAEVTSKKERQRVETENPSLANDLVIRAKARAAEKMRRLEQQK